MIFGLQSLALSCMVWQYDDDDDDDDDDDSLSSKSNSRNRQKSSHRQNQYLLVLGFNKDFETPIPNSIFITHKAFF